MLLAMPGTHPGICNFRDASCGLDGSRQVEITSRIGQIRAVVEVSDARMPGVVSWPHGWGHDRPGAKLSAARARGGVSVNDITEERQYDPLSGTSVLDRIPVTIKAVRAEAAQGTWRARLSGARAGGAPRTRRPRRSARRRDSLHARGHGPRREELYSRASGQRQNAPRSQRPVGATWTVTLAFSAAAAVRGERA